MNPAPQALHRITRLELAFCLACNRFPSPSFRRLFEHVSWLGNGPFWIAVAVLVLIVDGFAAGWPVVRHLLIAGAVAVCLYKLLKRRLARPRPFASGEGFELTVAPLDQYSFPSGHTLHAVAFTLVLAHTAEPFFWLVLPFTVLVALSRVFLGLHYPTDVLAGAALGSGVALVVLRL